MGVGCKSKKVLIICCIMVWISIMMAPYYVIYAEQNNQQSDEMSNVDNHNVDALLGDVSADKTDVSSENMLTDKTDASSENTLVDKTDVSDDNTLEEQANVSSDNTLEEQTDVSSDNASEEQTDASSDNMSDDQIGILSGNAMANQTNSSLGEVLAGQASTGGNEENNIGQIVNDAYKQHKLDIPDDVINITLPTSESFSNPFTIDPQGVLSIREDGDVCIPEAMGSVVPNTILSVRNASSFAVSVIIDAYVTENLGTGEPAPVKLRTDSEGLSETPNNELFLNMYSTNNITDEELAELRNSTKDYTLKDNAKFVNHVNIASNGREEAMEICFHLKEASYQTVVTENGNILVADDCVVDNYSQIAFCIGGMASQKSNWGRFAKTTKEKVALKLVFSIMKYDGNMSDKVEVDSYIATEPTYFSDANIYNFAEASNNRNVELLVPYLIDETLDDFKLPIDFGKGAKRTQIVDVYIIQGEDEEKKLTAGVDYDITMSGIILKACSDTLWGMRRPALCTLVMDGREADSEEVRLEVTFSTGYDFTVIDQN